MPLRLPQKSSCGGQQTPRSPSSPLRTATAALFWESNLRFRFTLKIDPFVVLCFEDAVSVPNESLSSLSTSTHLVALKHHKSHHGSMPDHCSRPGCSVPTSYHSDKLTSPHHLIFQRSQPSHHGATPDHDSISDTVNSNVFCATRAQPDGRTRVRSAGSRARVHQGS